MKPLLFVAIFSAFFVGARLQTCHLRELDLCVATLVLYAQGDSPIPVTDEDISNACNYFLDARQCLMNFTEKCMTPTQQQLVTFLSEGSQQALDEFCTGGTELRANYLKHAECLNNAYREQRSCITDVQAALEKTMDAKFDDRVPSLCCGYMRLRKCLDVWVETNCGKGGVDQIDMILHITVADLPNIICHNYDPDSPQCANLLPPVGTEPLGENSPHPLMRLISSVIPKGK